MDLRRDIRSLTDFKHNTPECVELLKQTGQPMVLTINGKAAIVVQDAGSYQELYDTLEEARAMEGIRQGLEDMKSGKGEPFEKVFEDIRRDFGFE